MRGNKWRKKPVTIDAVQWKGSNVNEMAIFAGRNVRFFDDKLYIHTMEGVMKANIGDFIIKGVQGEFYPCNRDIFLETYDKVE